MTSYELLHRYWRVPVVALLAGVLAFAASFVVAPTYESTTRLLVHGRDATFLSSTGQDLSAQPGVVDSSLSQALLSTYAGIATSRTVAVAVTDQLHLDAKPPSKKFYAPITRGLAVAYRCSRAFLTSGFCARVDPHEKAVLDVQNGTSAQPAGTNSGATAGNASSYILEVQSSGGTGAEAQAVTNAVADQLVAMSNDRFKREANANVAGLQAQVDAAQQVVRQRTDAVAAYQTAHDISAADAKQALSAATYESVRSDLLKSQAQLDDLQAQVSSTQASLASAPRDETSKQTIVTGRSTTETRTNGASSVYNDLLTQLSTLRSQEAGTTARIKQLKIQLAGAKPSKSNGPLAELVLLQQSADLASANVRDLTATLQKAQTTAAQGSVDLSRLDQASEPSYPAKPQRYVYLALGLLLGALAGAGLTARAARRSEAVPSEPVPPVPGEPLAAAAENENEQTLVRRLDLTEDPRQVSPTAPTTPVTPVAPEPELLPVGRLQDLVYAGGSNGYGSGANGYGTNGHSTNGHSTNGYGTNGRGTNGHGTNGTGANGRNGHAATGTNDSAAPGRREVP